MTESRFYTYAASTTVLALLSAFALFYAPFYPGVVSGILVLTGFYTYVRCSKTARSIGKTRNMKISLIFLPVVYEVVILLSIGLKDIVPRSLAAVSVAAVLLTYITQKGLIKELRETVKPDMGMKWRIFIIVLGLLLSDINIYYLTYAVGLVTFISFYDSFKMVYRQVEL